MLELDFEEYEKALQILLYPKIATTYLGCEIFRNHNIPYGLAEDDAIEYLFRCMRETPVPCFIHYQEIKTVYLEPNGRIYLIFYPPQ